MKATLFMDGRHPSFDEDDPAAAAKPNYFAYEFWVHSQLSTARFFGGCEYNGEHYEIDMETGDLVKSSFKKEYLKHHKIGRLERSAYAKARARGEV
jgi:hypothetical protein